MKITEITLKAFNNGSDITTIHGDYFTDDNCIHVVDYKKFVIEDLDELITIMDAMAGAIYDNYEYTTMNYTDKGGHFTRTYYFD